MDTSVVVTAVGASSAVTALFGVALTTYFQSHNQRANHKFQLDSDAAKHQREMLDRENTESLQRLTEAHKLLSRIAREFSVTNLDILWRASMTDSDYDSRYLSSCGEMDELRAFIGLYEPALSDDVEKLHGHMNLFWGNFKSVLHETSLGRNPDQVTSSLASTHAAAKEIGAKVAVIKRHLTELVEAACASL